MTLIPLMEEYTITATKRIEVIIMGVWYKN